MSQKKISELTSTASVKDHNIFPLVQDGVTKHIKYSDLKAPLVKEVEAEVEDYVDKKSIYKLNYNNTTMVKLGFAKNSYNTVRDFWDKLFSTYESNGVIHFQWNTAEEAYIGLQSGSNMLMSGGTLIYTCNGNSKTAYRNFSALFFSSNKANKVYHIHCAMYGDTSAGKGDWSITTLASNADVLSIRSTLLDVSGKLDYMYNRYPSEGKVVGKWHDGRNIWRVVYLAKDLTVTSAQSGNGSIYGFTGGLTKQRDVGVVLSAKVYPKSGAASKDMEVFLAHDDCIFTTGAVNASVSTENVDCLVVEFVEK